MAGNASLALLKGGAKKSTDAELDKVDKSAAEAAAAVVEESAKVDPTSEPSEDTGDTPTEAEIAGVTTEVAEAAESEEVEIDIDTMTGKQLDALIVEHEIEVPDTWKKMTVPDKKKWLNDKFSDAPADDAGDPETDVEPDAAVEVADTVDAAVLAATPTISEQVESAVAETEAAEEAVKAEASTEVAVAAETTVAKPKKGKAAAAQSGEILQPDVMTDIVHSVENLKEKEARDMVFQLNDVSNSNSFKLGGVLAKIQAEGWFQPYASFKDYVIGEHNMSMRTVFYWISIYNNLVANSIPWDKVKKVGWTKLKEIAHLLSPENVDHWVTVASENSTQELVALVQKQTQQAKLTDGTDAPAQTVLTKSFKLHEDQKKTVDQAIDKAKTVSGTTVDTVALEYICLDYIGGKQKSVTELLQGLSQEEAFAAIEAAFPDLDITVAEK